MSKRRITLCASKTLHPSASPPRRCAEALLRQKKSHLEILLVGQCNAHRLTHLGAALEEASPSGTRPLAPKVGGLSCNASRHRPSRTPARGQKARVEASVPAGRVLAPKHLTNVCDKWAMLRVQQRHSCHCWLLRLSGKLTLGFHLGRTLVWTVGCRHRFVTAGGACGACRARKGCWCGTPLPAQLSAGRFVHQRKATPGPKQSHSSSTCGRGPPTLPPLARLHRLRLSGARAPGQARPRQHHLQCVSDGLLM